MARFLGRHKKEKLTSSWAAIFDEHRSVAPRSAGQMWHIGGEGGFDSIGGALFEARWRICGECQKQVYIYAAVTDYVQNVRRTRPVPALFLRMLNLHLDPYYC